MRISGPLLDRIDIHIEVPRLRQDDLISTPQGEASTAIRERVVRARRVQQQRFAGRGFFCNAHMKPKDLRTCCVTSDEARELLKNAITHLSLSARAYDRILKLSRTIADLDGAEEIGVPHVAEAIQYRSLDRKLWG
jgi:magnesium chelatase family protein